MRQEKIDKQNIIIRHSIREQIIDAQDSQRQVLTKDGVILAQQLGKKIALHSNNFSIFHSPVLRCKQTAIEINNGILYRSKKVYAIEQMDLLGGFFFINWDYCSKLINQQCFLEKWFAGVISTEYIIPIKDAANMMLNNIISRQNNNLTNIFITHDFNIFCLRSLYSKTFEDIEYPDYLDGIIISNDKGYFENIRCNEIIDEI